MILRVDLLLWMKRCFTLRVTGKYYPHLDQLDGKIPKSRCGLRTNKKNHSQKRA